MGGKSVTSGVLHPHSHIYLIIVKHNMKKGNTKNKYWTKKLVDHWANIVNANLSKARSFSQMIIVHSRKRQSKPTEVGNQSSKIRIVILVNTKLMPKIKPKCGVVRNGNETMPVFLSCSQWLISGKTREVRSDVIRQNRTFTLGLMSPRPPRTMTPGTTSSTLKL